MSVPNRMTSDEWMQVEGAKMVLRALPDFIRKWRSVDMKGTPRKDRITVISSSYDPSKPTANGDDKSFSPHGDNSPYAYIKGVSTDMIIDAVIRLCANTYDCEKFIHGNFPEWVRPHYDKKGKISSIDFSYYDTI